MHMVYPFTFPGHAESDLPLDAVIPRAEEFDR